MEIKEEDYTRISSEQVDKISAKIKLFLLILVRDKLLYYDNSVFEVIKFLNELKSFDINKFKNIEICKIIYHTYFLNNLYDDDVYNLINCNNAEQLFNYIVYCNNNGIINNRIIKLTKIFINTNKKKLLKIIGYYYFSYASILSSNRMSIITSINLFDYMVSLKEIYKIFLDNKNIKNIINNYCKRCKQPNNNYDEQKYDNQKYNKYLVIEKLINHEPNELNILPLVTNDILVHINSKIQVLVITGKIIDKNEYSKKFDEFNFNKIYCEFIIKKTNSKLYNLLMYIFYDKFILNYKNNSIFDDYDDADIRDPIINNKYSLSYIYLSEYWSFIEKKILQENILNTIEYEELYNYYKIIHDKYNNVKNYLIKNNLQFQNKNISINLNMHFANCLYIQYTQNANIAFIYAYLPKVNFGLNI